MGLVDVTVIGGGPVGLFAAFYAGMRGMSVRIIESLPQLGGQLVALYPEKSVYDVAGFKDVRAKDLANGFVQQGVQFGPEVVLEEVADGLRADAGNWIITGRSGTDYPTKTVIIAAGAGSFSPTKLGIDGEENWVGRGLSYGVKSTSDFAGKEVAIVGGGDSAFDWAVHLAGVARKVTIVHRRDEFRAHAATVDAAAKCGVGVLTFKVVDSVIGQDVLTGLNLKDTKDGSMTELICDKAVVCIGFKSSLGPILSWGLETEKNAIKVDHLMRTNLQGVFSVGDVCTYEGKLKLIATGVGEAASAVCVAKTELDPGAKMFPGHSSDMAQFTGPKN